MPIPPLIIPPSISSGRLDPTKFGYRPTPVEVWQEQPDGSFAEISDTIECDRIQLRSDGDVDRATFHVVFREGFPPMTRAYGSSTFRSDYLARGMAFADPNRRLRVFFSSGQGRRFAAFEGFPILKTLSWTRRPEGHGEGISFEAIGALDRWRFDREAQIIGRTVHQDVTAEELGPDNLISLRSQPCTFNENGEPNCSPYWFATTYNFDEEDVPIGTYVFASRHERKQWASATSSRTVIEWTYARALWYLLYFYGLRAYQISGNAVPIALDDAWILQLGKHLMREPDNGTSGTAIGRALRGSPRNLQVDRTNLLDALTLVASEAGIHFHVEYDGEEDGEVDPTLRVWGDGFDYTYGRRPHQFRLTRRRPRSAPGSQSFELRQNNAMGLTASEDYEIVRNVILIAGATRNYEARFDLVPGWLPLTNLDNVATEDCGAAKDSWFPLGPGSRATPGTEEQYRRSSVNHGFVADDGRKWILDTGGTYFPALFARTVGPFLAAFYVPFKPTDYVLQDLRMFSGTGGVRMVPIRADEWAYRPRPFRDLLYFDDDEITELPPWVEISFDSGTTWQHETRVESLPAESAIRFTAESPLEYVPAEAATAPSPWWTDNMWYAIIEGRFRVRVTASIEGDDLLVPGSGFTRSSMSPLDRDRVQIFDRPDYELYIAVGRDPAITPPEIVRSDLDAANRLRGTFVDHLADRTFAARAEVPWLSLLPKRSYAVVGPWGIGVIFARKVGRDTRYPQIVGIDYDLVTQTTRPILGDLRFARDPVFS